MGGLCCCPVSDNSNGNIPQRCTCFQGCFTWFFQMYSTLFGNFMEDDVQQHSSLSMEALTRNRSEPSLINLYRAPPAPLPYDAETRYMRLQHGGQNKARVAESCCDEGDSARALGQEAEVSLLSRYSSESEQEGKEQFKLMKPDSVTSLADDEDICPTCLDVYTEENPKINTDCGHHFHLACILEWMERSKNCPVCDKEMVFHEV